MNGILAFLLSFTSGYTFFQIFTHPGKKKHLIPHLKFKNIELLPNFKIHFRKTTYHIHHWVYLTAFAVVAYFFFESLLQFIFVKGIAFGGIVQGLRFKDRFKVRHPRFDK